jgi:ABC-type polysaccharide/polyol phosphate export permease
VNSDFWDAVWRALTQWRLAWLLTAANLIETRRLNKLALLTPFLSVLLQTAFLGLIYRALLGMPLATYLPYLAVSLALWQAFANFLTNAAVYNEIINRHMSFTRLSPYTLHLAGLFETILLLIAKLAAALIVIVVLGRASLAVRGLPSAILGLLALGALLFFLGILAAYSLDRYRILKALLPQVLFFAFLATPVLWPKEQLGGLSWLAEWNPLYHGLEVVRVPLLEGTTPWISMLVVLLVTAALALACTAAHRLNREMIVFRWVA